MRRKPLGDAEVLAVFRPARLNFAGVCLWCGQRWCQSPTCIANHEASSWAVCPTCGGGADGEYEPVCTHCVHGVVSMCTAAAAAVLNAPYLPSQGVVVERRREFGAVAA